MSVEPETATDTDTGSVWVVTYRSEGDPHSHVAGVYDNEEAARDHKHELANQSFEHGAAAWGVHEATVGSQFDGGEYTEEADA